MKRYLMILLVLSLLAGALLILMRFIPFLGLLLVLIFPTVWVIIALIGFLEMTLGLLPAGSLFGEYHLLLFYIPAIPLQALIYYSLYRLIVSEKVRRIFRRKSLKQKQG